ncbi:MAG: flagellar export chaperone FliS [Desulforhabdus sp.]|nr:flagellar export chaperone FliS [Desulforhabdus sp.]
MMNNNAAMCTNPPLGNPPPSPQQLVVMCYQAAIRDLQQAKEFHRNGISEAVYKRVRHVQDIVTELLVGLDYERGGEIARNLSRIYNFVLRQLIGIHNNQEEACYDQLIQILENLKGAWESLN